MSEREKLKVSTRSMFDEFLRQNIPVRIISSSNSLLEFIDSSGKSRLMFSTSSEKCSASGHFIANNKLSTEIIAIDLGIPTPSDIICKNLDDAKRFLKKYKKIVLKPLKNSGGSGVSTNITDTSSLANAYEYAQQFGTTVIAQQHIEGSDIRLLVIAGKFRSAVERRPASVIGDGIKSIAELIKLDNASGERSAGSMSSKVLIDEVAVNRYLGNDVTRIPQAGEVVRVVGPANVSLGGTAHEATEIVTKKMIEDAEKISRKLKLGICGVDMMFDKKTHTYKLIEVNSTPGINMHNDATWGTKSDAIEHYVKWLISDETMA